MVRFYLLVSLLWISQILSGQEQAYLHYEVRDGLPSNLVYCGLQDQNGLLWFGTDKGLACFDGIRFHVYGMKDGLPDPEVLNLKMDSKGRMWIGCFQQKPCYMLHGKIITYEKDALLAKVSIESGLSDFFEDVDGSIWIANSNSTLYRLHDQSVDTFNFPGQSPTMVRRFDQSLFVFSSSEVIRLSPNRTKDSVAGFQPIRDRYQYYGGIAFNKTQFVISLGNHLIQYQWKDNTFTLISNTSEATDAVYSDKTGRFWACSTLGGAYLFRKNPLESPEVFLPDIKINSLFEDRQGTLWFLTYNNGIISLPTNVPVTYAGGDKLPSSNIKSIAVDFDRSIYTGDEKGNISHIRGLKTETFRLQTGALNKLIRQILPVSKDSIWICSDAGIFLLQGRLSTPAPSCYSPKSIAAAGGKLWVANSRTICYLQPGILQRIDIATRRFTSVQVDWEGHIWAGAMSGLYSEIDSFSRNWGDSFRYLKGRILCIQSAGKNRLWVVTPENGLLNVWIDHGAVSRVDRVNDMLEKPIENIQSVFVTSGNPDKIWLATNRGVIGLDKMHIIAQYDTHNGLADDDVNTVLVSGDTLWAGTVSGLTRVIIRPEEQHPDFATYIVGLHYQTGEHLIDSNFVGIIQQHRTIVLPADANRVEIELTGLDYRSRGNLHFECIRSERLLPLWCWTPGNMLNILKFNILNRPDTLLLNSGLLNFGFKIIPGHYFFQVYALSSNSVRSNLPDQFSLIMLPHWYETLWFWLAFWVIVYLIIRRIYKSRIAFRELNAAASELQLQALQAQMNPHFVGNSINAIQQFFYPPDPEKASEYISLFTRLLRQTMLFSERRFIPLREELAYDEDYLKMVQLRFGDRFEYRISGADTIDPEIPFPAMILQPLLENATIHGLSEEGISKLLLTFSKQHEILTVTLIDNGPGITETLRRKSQATGFDRQSKGMEMVTKKMDTFNRMFNISLQITFTDLSEIQPGQTGTQVVISYQPGRILG